MIPEFIRSLAGCGTLARRGRYDMLRKFALGYLVAVWASASGGFRIVSDTLVIITYTLHTAGWLILMVT